MHKSWSYNVRRDEVEHKQHVDGAGEMRRAGDEQ